MTTPSARFDRVRRGRRAIKGRGARATRPRLEGLEDRVVLAYDTSTALMLSPSGTVEVGDAVTMTATVASTPAFSGLPGTVTFYEFEGRLGNVALQTVALTSDVATYTTGLHQLGYDQIWGRLQRRDRTIRARDPGVQFEHVADGGGDGGRRRNQHEHGPGARAVRDRAIWLLADDDGDRVSWVYDQQGVGDLLRRDHGPRDEWGRLDGCRHVRDFRARARPSSPRGRVRGRDGRGFSR